MAENIEKDGQVSFKDTLNLPTTDFPIRPNAKEDDPKMIERWEKEDLYRKTFDLNRGQEKFILHDGPPFANGHLHLGHAYNNILKDIVAKSQRMMGKNVPVTPGWDCHGLPIEFNVTKENPGLSKVEIIKKCREYAQTWVDIQKQERKSLGVLMDFERPYLTMSHDYEANIMRAFGEFVAQGYIERKNKTVSWCYTCQTVLASAEIEYQDRKDPSIYVQFPILLKNNTKNQAQNNVLNTQNNLINGTQEPDNANKNSENKNISKFIEDLASELGLDNLSLLIWTTTPWTLPLNRAVIVKPKEKYVILNINNKNVILGKNLVEKVCAAVLPQAGKNTDSYAKKQVLQEGIMGQEDSKESLPKVLAEFDSEKLSGLFVNHPFVDNLQVPVIFDPFVAVDEGTACVHCAPGCGQEDYEVAIKNGIEVFSPITPDGRYATGIIPKELEGMRVVISDKERDALKDSSLDGQIWVIKKLLEKDLLLHKASIKHSYPHCWRCRNGLIFRATKQWFCDLSKNNFRDKALKACDSIKSVPENSINRLKAAIENRLEWCLSRQRVWGVPIAALICNKCDKTFVSKEFIDKVAEKVEKEGIAYWDIVTERELLAILNTQCSGEKSSDLQDSKTKELRTQDFCCQSCGSKDFRKEVDILDVWLESGVSHYAVLSQRKDLGYPADVYLEGKDQHRGWFQSSLLTSLILHKDKEGNGIPCMRNIITHGFTVDEKGVKMSKSLGNVVSSAQMIEKLGTDGLRLWAASIDYSSEAVVSEVLIKNVQEVFRKIRNTERFLLSNLYDFDINHDAVNFDEMLLIDRYALETLYNLNKEIIFDYEKFDFTSVAHQLADYVTKDLSSYYLDIIKDRLYVEKSNGHLRRSAQTACWYILDTLTKLIAPIMSFTAEQVSDNYQKNKTESVHMQQFANLENFIKKICSQEKAFPALQAKLGNFSCYCNTQEAIDLMRALSENKKIWKMLEDIRSVVLKAIEVQREKQVMRHSLEASVTVFFDILASENKSLNGLQDNTLNNGLDTSLEPSLKDLIKFYDMLKKSGKNSEKIDANGFGQSVEDFFKEFFIVSQFKIAQSSVGLENSGLEGVFVKVEKASGVKCPRCWNWSDRAGDYGLCPRCQAVLK